MCGIAGILNTEPKATVGTELISRMLSTIVHRGPDDQGIHSDGQMAFGTRRLKIIDLSAGHQPLSNEDRTVWVAFNGELYNHEDRRKELALAGHHFRTRCDTEVIVHEWEEHGTQCVNWLE